LHTVAHALAFSFASVTFLGDRLLPRSLMHGIRGAAMNKAMNKNAPMFGSEATCRVPRIECCACKCSSPHLSIKYCSSLLKPAPHQTGQVPERSQLALPLVSAMNLYTHVLIPVMHFYISKHKTRTKTNAFSACRNASHSHTLILRVPRAHPCAPWQVPCVRC
jgi:hypothetical protein